MSANLERIEAVFHQALEFGPEERAAFLAGACGGDAALLAKVQALLRAHETAAGFLPEQPKAGATVGIVTEQPGDHIGHYKLLEQIGEGVAAWSIWPSRRSPSGAGSLSRSSSWVWTPNTSLPGSKPSARPWP